MKRKGKHGKEETLCLELPQEVWGEIALQCCFESVVAVVRFASICRATQRSLPLLLPHWGRHLVRQLSFAQAKMTEEATIFRRFLVRNGVSPKRLEQCFTTHAPPKRDTLLAIYEMHTLAMANDHYFAYAKDEPRKRIQKGEPFVMYSVARDMILSDTKLSSAFCYDEATETVVPLLNMPGLRICNAPKTLSATHQAIRAKLEEGPMCPILRKYALRGLLNTRTTQPDLRADYCTLMGSEQLSFIPSASSLLCNVMLNGDHLFSDEAHTNQILNRLYLCKQKPQHCTPEFAVFRYATELARVDALRSSIPPLASPQGVSLKISHPMVSSDSDYSSSSESDT